MERRLVNVIFDFIDFYGWIIFIYILVSILINGCFYYFFSFLFGEKRFFRKYLYRHGRILLRLIVDIRFGGTVEI